MPLISRRHGTSMTLLCKQVPHSWVRSALRMKSDLVITAVKRLWVFFALLAFSGVASAGPELKRVTTDNPAPPIELKTFDGKPFKLEQLRGKVVLVNFWATWCEPCVEEMPSIQKLRNQLRNAPFEVVAVNHQEGEARI